MYNYREVFAIQFVNLFAFFTSAALSVFFLSSLLEKC